MTQNEQFRNQAMDTKKSQKKDSDDEWLFMIVKPKFATGFQDWFLSIYWV